MNIKKRKGFTLVEIMIVVVIIGLLATMAIPQFAKMRGNAQNSKIVNNVRQITSAADQYMMERGKTTVALTELVGSGNYIKVADPASLVILEEVYPTSITSGGDYVVTGLPAGLGGHGVDNHVPKAGSTTLHFTF